MSRPHSDAGGGAPTPDLFRIIAEYTYDWETWVDAEGRPRWVNAAVERITGYAVDECLAMADYPVSLVHEHDRALVSAIVRDAERRGSGNDIEFRIVRKDGVERWVAISWQSLTDSTGNPAGYRTSVRDIDERKRMEQELRNLRKRAESAVIARSELLANVSHELRSPAHCISGFAELLEAGTLDEKQRRYVELIRGQCGAMQRQVDDLLHLAALEAGGLSLEREPVELVTALQTLVESAEPSARVKGLALRFDHEAQRVWVEADAARVLQIVRNLLDNAVKFTERGEVALSLRSTARERGVQQVQVEVSDTGIGMNLEEARRVLAPFQQADGSTRRRYGGVGLGLAIAHRLVTHMGGTLEVESELGRGTKIRVLLPLAGVDELRREAATRPPSPLPQHALHGGRALIVDDSAPARELLRAMLELSGWQTECAAGGNEAQRLMASQAFDLVLLDYQMPDADGAETAVALRRLSQTRRLERPVRIYLLTANLFAHEQLSELAAIDGVLAKPLSRAALLTLLSEAETQGLSQTANASPAQEASAPDPDNPLDPKVIEDSAGSHGPRRTGGAAPGGSPDAGLPA
ncbi:MAG: ATP-binding protein [Myxococcales bacterium]